MSFFAPFAFIRTELGVPPAPPVSDIPPHSPFAYYDATNTAYSSASVWNDVVSSGSANMTFKPKPGAFIAPTYTAGEYYTYNGSNTNFELTGSSALTDFMNNLEGYEHTKIALLFPTSTAEEDFMSGASTITMIFANTSPAANAVRGHVFSGGGTLATDSSISTTTSVYWFGGQRFSTSSVSQGRVDVISGGAGSLPATITNGSNGGWTFNATGDTRFIVGARNLPNRAFFDGRIAQMVVYDKPLTDTEVQDVLLYMKDRQGI